MNNEEKNFDSARSEVEALFNGEQTIDDVIEEDAAEQVQEEAPTEEVPTEEVPIQDAPTEETVSEQAMAQTEEAVTAAEQAVAVAQQKDAQVQQLSQELEAERQRSAALQKQNEEMSAQREEEIIEEVLTPPVLDIASLAFESPEAQAEAQRRYAEEMTAYNQKMMEKELAPLKERARKADELEIIEAVKSQVVGDKRFTGFSDMLPKLQSIIKNNKALANSDIPYDEKLIQAYAIVRGLDAMEAPEPEPAPEMTTDEFVDKYKQNPDFRKAIEQLRIAELNDSQQVPPLASSTGAGNVARNIKEKPETLSEASERTRQMFR